MNPIRRVLLVAAAGSTVAAFVAYISFGHRPYLFVIAFVCFLATFVIYAYGGGSDTELADDLRRGDDPPPRKQGIGPMGPNPPGSG